MIAICLAGLAVYANSLHGPFLFDDHLSILESASVRSLWPLSSALGAPEGSVASGRPLVAFSLALNYAWGEYDVFGYHVVNVLAHVGTALALFGLLRRGLARTQLRDIATRAAFLTSLVWVVHPLCTDALNQIVSRSEIFAAGLYLACAYAAERSFDGIRSHSWQTLAVLACAAAMASKEFAVSAPLFVLAYDRTLVSGSFSKALAARPRFYTALAATWIVLGLSIASGDRGMTVGFGQDVTSLDYLRTQAQGLVHYLRLAAWPRGLVIDYSGWPLVSAWGPALVPGLVVLGLFCGACVLFWRARGAGLVALGIFAVLAPSSSFIPLAGERLAEHRMYLPLAGIVALVVPLLFCWSRRLWPVRGLDLATAFVVLLTLPLAWVTHQRNEQYASAETIWIDALAAYPDNGRAHDHLAAILVAEGRLDEALPHAQEAVRLAPELHTVEYNLATILMQLGQSKRALTHFQRAEPHRSGTASFHGNYGVVLGQVQRLEEALYHLRRALELDPDYLAPQRNLGILLAQAGRGEQAAPHLRHALAERPEPELMLLLGRILATHPDPLQRDGPEALRLARQLIAGADADPRWYDLLAMAQAELGQFEDALDSAQRALNGARRMGRDILAREIADRITLYRDGRPFRE
jgi:tetratricopeptide (TPR) repeat protein